MNNITEADWKIFYKNFSLLRVCLFSQGLEKECSSTRFTKLLNQAFTIVNF